MTPSILLTGLLVLALLRSLANYARLEAEGRGVMALLRIGAVGALVGVLLAPSWVRRVVDRLRPRLVVLVDGSTSMLLPLTAGDSPAGRIEAARAAVRDLTGHYGESFDLEVRAFSAGVDADRDPAGDPTGTATDLRRTLEEALRNLDGRTRALFLVTDGRATRGGYPGALARTSRVPIHGIQTGEASRAPLDVAVLDVDVPEEGFAGGGVRVKARLRARGLTDARRVRAVLKVGGEEVATLPVPLPDGTGEGSGDEVEVEFRWTPDAGGMVPLEVAVEGAGDQDESTRDDRAETSILVHQEPVPVLVLAGRPTPDLAFVRRVLVRDPRFALTVVASPGQEKPVALPPPGAAGDLRAVPLVILAGFAADRFPPEAQRELLTFVEERGGALVLLGNGPREWKDLAGSRLADLLPVAVASDAPPLEKRLPVQPQAGASHPLTRVIDHPQANLQAWQRLPPVAPGARGVPAAGARVFLAFPYYPRSIPLLATRAKGRGTVVALNSTETYLWQTMARAHDDEVAVHERFFAGLAAWAADPARAGGERLELARRRYRPGETLRVRWHGSEDGAPPSAVELVPAGAGTGRRLTLERRGAGQAEGTLELEEPGVYELRPLSGEAAPQLLAVHASREEALQPAPDPETLRNLTEASGGSYLVAGAGGIDERLLPPVDAAPIVRERTRGVYWLDEPLVLALCLLLFCAEWWLRRRQNLV